MPDRNPCLALLFQKHIQAIMMNIEDLKFNCKYFKGYIPCLPNKQKGEICDTCRSYIPVDKRILIIKLGATGDVIRTTPLVVKYKTLYPNCHITWLTHSPAVLPPDKIDEILKYDFTSVFNIRHNTYDIAINLDKEQEACLLLKEVEACEKYGYTWEDNHIALATPAAEAKLMTGLFDQVSRENKKHYLEEIFEICHLTFNDEPYLLNYDPELVHRFDYIRELAGTKKIVGLNTGCGARWKTRLWTKANWMELSRLLEKQGYFVMFIGGEAEDALNQEMAQETKIFYPGHFSLKEFIALSSLCTIVVTQVSMMMHIATALEKKLVLINNIFNSHEFYMYHRGIIIEPPSGCDCYYGITCNRAHRCMEDITPEMLAEAVRKVD